jgi:catechol 2,3-dioxygenase-like lactoylglutathione lyase family enzyme
MKLIKYVCLFIFSISLCSAQDSPAELGVAAIGLVVSNIETSEDFYKNVLGFEPTGGFTLDSTWSQEAGAANDNPFAVKMFKLVNAKTATILKLAYFDSVAKRPDQSGVDSYAGVNYLTFYYPDLATVNERLVNAGIEKLGWVKRDTYQLIFVRDPDGVFIELIGPPD